MFDPKFVSLGIAPIGWCNDDMPELGAENTFQQTVSEMALAGFWRLWAPTASMSPSRVTPFREKLTCRSSPAVIST